MLGHLLLGMLGPLLLVLGMLLSFLAACGNTEPEPEPVPEDPAQLSGFERMKVVERLAERGAFQIKGTVSEVAIALGTSESTVYRYLKKVSR